MKLVKLENGVPSQWPVGIGMLKNENPTVSFPKKLTDNILNHYGYAKFEYTNKPEYNEVTQEVQEVTPTQEGNVYKQQWNVVEKYNTKAEKDAALKAYQDTEDAKAALGVRSKRDGLLHATDYLALSDNTMTSEMAAYRKALRDITNHENFPHLEDNDWPVHPDKK